MTSSRPSLVPKQEIVRPLNPIHGQYLEVQLTILMEVMTVQIAPKLMGTESAPQIEEQLLLRSMACRFMVLKTVPEVMLLPLTMVFSTKIANRLN